MKFSLKKSIFSILFNSSLFLLLIIGIQNSTKKHKVNFLINESVNLPVSFIVGVSFISGSLAGSFVSLNYWNKK